jgi:hypothetical protein
MRILVAALCACAGLSAANVYEVGPGRPLAAIGDVPWTTLEAGDTALIYWRPEPYREKWVVARQGTADAPITIRGVPGPEGQLPIIDGEGAITPASLNFSNEVRGVIKIGSSNSPPDTLPRYITIENLDVRNGHQPLTFTGRGGLTQTYAQNAAAIYIEKGENIVIRRCSMHGSGNGLFIGSGAANITRDILIEANYIYDNGNVGSGFEHNSYTEALGIVFQFNHYGPLRDGALGNNLKDRSGGLTVRYNWIESGNRQLDLVDSDFPGIRDDPRYRQTFVYGNVLIEPDGAGNRQITHYGGDGADTASYRRGTLYFYNNTVVSTRTDRTTLFRLSTPVERCDARNNIFYVTAAGSTVSLLDSDGTLDLSHNWFKPGWVRSFGEFRGVANDDGTAVVGASPGVLDEAAQDFRLATGSPAIDAGALPHPAAPDPVWQYVKHQLAVPRPFDGRLDLGAYEYPFIGRVSRSRAGAPR